MKLVKYPHIQNPLEEKRVLPHDSIPKQISFTDYSTPITYLPTIIGCNKVSSLFILNLPSIQYTISIL